MNKLHWEKVFSTKPSAETSWFKPHLEISLEMIERASIPKSAPLIDVGGGDSTLIDDLLEAGYLDLTVLDISAAALERSRARLGSQAQKIRWLEADITQTQLAPDSFALWHDRAAFHFLVEQEAREAYLQRCRTAMKNGGTLILATFAQDGPEKCSGLPAMRYSPQDLERQLGADFQLLDSKSELHITPGRKIQSFVYCRFIKRKN